MNEYFKIKETLENQGYTNVEITGGGFLVVATKGNEVFLFDLMLRPIPISDDIRVEKIKDGKYKIVINKYSTEYEVLSPQKN